MSERQFIRIEHDGPVSVLTIARSDKMNALDRDVLTELRSAVEELDGRRETQCVVVTGEGKAFVAGADIASMKSMGSTEAREFSKLGHDTFDALESMRCPAIAAVNGFALGGGCELALACDFIYASDRAKLGQPEVKLGVVPGFGGTQRLSRRVGAARARELIYTGATVDAEEALRIGLVNRVLSSDQLMEETKRTAQAIAKQGPLAVSAAKELISDGLDRTLSDANTLEIEAFAGCFDTSDQSEGMDAFLNKREPDFKAK